MSWRYVCGLLVVASLSALVAWTYGRMARCGETSDALEDRLAELAAIADLADQWVESSDESVADCGRRLWALMDARTT
jgi:hypothetical protein